MQTGMFAVSLFAEQRDWMEVMEPTEDLAGGGQCQICLCPASISGK